MTPISRRLRIIGKGMFGFIDWSQLRICFSRGQTSKLTKHRVFWSVDGRFVGSEQMVQFLRVGFRGLAGWVLGQRFRDDMLFSEPFAQINKLAAPGAERAVWFGKPVSFFFASGAGNVPLHGTKFSMFE